MDETPTLQSFAQFSRLLDDIEKRKGGSLMLRALRAPHLDDPFLYRIPLRAVSRLHFYI